MSFLRISVCAVFLVPPGCGREPERAPPAEPPKLGPLSGIDFPAVAEPEGIALEVPSGPVGLRWSFPAGAVIEYELLQKGERVDHAQGGAPVPMRFEGAILLRAQGEGKASMTFMIAPEGVALLDREKLLRLDYGVTEDGSVYPTSDTSARAGGLELDILFSLPPRALALGESFEREIRVKGKGTTPAQFGSLRTTLAGFVKIRRHACARLESLLDLRLRPAEGSSLVGEGRMKARILSFFAVEEGFFTEVRSAGRMTTRFYAPVEREGKKEFALLDTELDTQVTVRQK